MKKLSQLDNVQADFKKELAFTGFGNEADTCNFGGSDVPFNYRHEGSPYSVGNVNFNKQGSNSTNLAIDMGYPRPSGSSLQVGNYIRLKNMGKYSGDYRINKVWIDKNGDVGAIYINCPYVTESLSNVSTWKGTGKVIKLHNSPQFVPPTPPTQEELQRAEWNNEFKSKDKIAFPNDYKIISGSSFFGGGYSAKDKIEARKRIEARKTEFMQKKEQGLPTEYIFKNPSIKDSIPSGQVFQLQQGTTGFKLQNQKFQDMLEAHKNKGTTPTIIGDEPRHPD